MICLTEGGTGCLSLVRLIVLLSEQAQVGTVAAASCEARLVFVYDSEEARHSAPLARDARLKG